MRLKKLIVRGVIIAALLVGDYFGARWIAEKLIPKDILFPYSYVAVINTESYKEAEIKNILEDFNKLGHLKLVRYEGIRPIIIYDRNFTDKGKEWRLGETMGAPLWCEIQLKKDMSPYFLRFVLIHEYLHCFGYDHTNIPSDLMYPEISYNLTDFDLLMYAQDLEKKYGK